MLPTAVSAFDLEVTDLEFAVWPQYCQARFSTIPQGAGTRWAETYPKQGVEVARRELGAATYERVHHYCNGLVWLSRARVEADPKLKAFNLHQARGEVMFTHHGLPANSPLMARSFIALAQISKEEGHIEAAVEELERGIELRPTDPALFTALALVYRSNKQLNLARDALLRGDKALEGESAGIHYNLGLIYLELGDTDSALQRAHSAYALGYPLDGLRKKLKALGKWSEPPPPAPVEPVATDP